MRSRRWWAGALAAVPARTRAAVAAGRHAWRGAHGAVHDDDAACDVARGDDVELWLDATGVPAAGVPVHGGRVTVHAPLDPVLGARLWDLHRRAMAPMRELAVLDHQLGRESLLALAADPAALTLVAWTSGRPSAFVLLTTNLEAAPQISAEAIAVRYPDAVARGAVLNWVCVAADPDVDDPTATLALMRVSTRIATARRGVIVLDLCAHNRSVVGIERAMRVVARRTGADAVDELDSQTWFAVSFVDGPAPAGPHDAQADAPADAGQGGAVLVAP